MWRACEKKYDNITKKRAKCVKMTKEDSRYLRLEYVKLSRCRLWEGNLKLHNLGELIESIEQHGFKDPPKYEPELNGGRGGIVEGNGRLEALDVMYREGRGKPRGIREGEGGEWLVPVIYGVAAMSEIDAESYGVDHNATVLGGGDYDLTDHMRMWSVGIIDKLAEIEGGGGKTVAFDGDDIERLIAWEAREGAENGVGAGEEVGEEVGGGWGVKSGEGEVVELNIRLTVEEMERWQEMKSWREIEDDSEMFRELVFGGEGNMVGGDEGLYASEMGL